MTRGDSMSPAYHNAVLVKRIVACPGDQIIIRLGTEEGEEILGRIIL